MSCKVKTQHEWKKEAADERDTQLQCAVQAYRNQISHGRNGKYKQIADIYNVSSTMLWHCVHGDWSIQKFNKTKRKILRDGENILALYAKNLTLYHIPLIHALLRQRVNAMLIHNTGDPTTHIGKSWTKDFLCRHSKELFLYWSSGMENK